MSIDALVYAEPDPRKVYEIATRYGEDAARERWGWVSPSALQRLVRRGRALALGRREDGRTTTPEQEERIIATCARAGVTAAAHSHGVSLEFVHRLHAERGLETPIIPHAERSRRAWAVMRARRAEVSVEVPVEAIARAYLDGMTLKEVGDRYGVSHNHVKNCLERLGVPRRQHGGGPERRAA